MHINDVKESLRILNQINIRVGELSDSIGIEKLKLKLSEIELLVRKDEIWQDTAKFAELNQEISRLKKKIEPFLSLKKEIEDGIELINMALAEDDMELISEITSNIKKYEDRFSELETKELLSDTDDTRDAFVTIHPGAGGTESQDWASMLLRMYTRWSEKNRFVVEYIDYAQGDEAGIKTATILVKGEYAYGLLKGERGVHRLVRISPFDANKRRHTSFASIDILPDIDDSIEVVINENDLKIDTFRASGAGGQHVNKTDSAVRITHLPTGIVVQCQNERSQHKNKAFAMKILKAQLYERHKSEQNEKKMELAADKKEISWGNQIRSYVFQPYTLVKDHRTDEETGSIDFVFDGEINRFLYAYLKSRKSF